MRIIVEIGHPAHVHHFKHMIWELEKRGCDIKIVVKKKDIAIDLLKAYNFDYEIIGINYDKLFGKACGIIKSDYKLLLIAKNFKPDLFISRASPHSAHVSAFLNKPHMAFCDTEHSTLSDLLAYPFTNIICTSSCYQKTVNPKKHVTFSGYKEIAYLHPNYFKPSHKVLDEIGLKEGEKFIVIRLVSWKASHDAGDKGFTNLNEVISSLEKYARILITSESKLPTEFDNYKITLAPEQMHNLLNYADLYIGESATMATECVILGVPAIFVSTSKRGYTEELEKKYDLMYTFSDSIDAQKSALEKALYLLEDKDTNKKWQKKRDKMLNDKIDVTKFMVDLVLKHSKI